MTHERFNSPLSTAVTVGPTRAGPGAVAWHRPKRRPTEGRKVRVPRARRQRPGAPAGVEYHELIPAPTAPPARVICTDYCPEQCQVQEVTDLAAFLAVHRPAWSQVRWISVEGTDDRATIRALAEKYELHPLAIEDVLSGLNRPKAEDYDGNAEHPARLFVVARRILIRDGDVQAEQVNLFLGRHTLLTIQSTPCPAMDEVRGRIGIAQSRLRQNDASFLLYALLDTLVDRFYPVLDDLSQQLEELEEVVIDRPDHDTLHAIHQVKRGLVMIRRVAWPMREMIAALLRERHQGLSEITQTYFRDVYDHCVQIIDLIETYRDIASELADTYVSVNANRTNDIMKVLTIIGTIFIPLTFLAGVYGMNMPIPENHWAISYPIFWTVCLAIAGYMLWRFRRGGWL